MDGRKEPERELRASRCGGGQRKGSRKAASGPATRDMLGLPDRLQRVYSGSCVDPA